ncbi:MAG TPA: LysM domain-containing protein [Planctomycetota bacterium]|nr:LysM domain-containing protein [Planctomycetota bacterium]
MLQAIWSFVAVLLLVAMGFLVYQGRNTDTKNDNGITATATPPPAPAPVPAPAPLPVAPAPQPAPAQPPVVQPPAPAPIVAEPEIKPAKKAKRTHVVQTGDTLSGICRKYYGTPDYFGKLAEANNLRSRDHIRVGQVLVLPDLPVVESAAATDDEEPQVSTQNFEPQPPTLNITVPRP